MKRAVVAAVAGLLVSAPPALAAGSGGGASAPSGGSAGGATYNSHPPHKRKPKRHAVLREFSIGTGRVYDLGTPARIAWRIDSRAKRVHVKLEVRRAGRRIRLIDLGNRRTRSRQTYRLTGREQGLFPEGALQLRLVATRLRPRAHVSSVSRLGFYRHRFPLVGRFDYGGADARFGAGRRGHTHEGQDLTAPEGTHVVAPRGGTVTSVDYQRGGAGYYVIVAVAGEDRSYAFMHLSRGSTRVRAGEAIRTGARIGDVGHTGDASGPHLHFEIWNGAWRAGGSPVDPLPSLRRWDAVS